MAWTYFLLCADGSFYVGSTTDLDSRMSQHASGCGNTYTASRLPVQLVWTEEFDHIDEAWAMERRLHGWSRAKKQALVDGRYNDLRDLAKRPRPF